MNEFFITEDTENTETQRKIEKHVELYPGSRRTVTGKESLCRMGNLPVFRRMACQPDRALQWGSSALKCGCPRNQTGRLPILLSVNRIDQV